MKQKTLAQTKEFKSLMKRIDKAARDPQFVKSIERFVKIASNH